MWEAVWKIIKMSSLSQLGIVIYASVRFQVAPQLGHMTVFVHSIDWSSIACAVHGNVDPAKVE